MLPQCLVNGSRWGQMSGVTVYRVPRCGECVYTALKIPEYTSQIVLLYEYLSWYNE